MTTNGIGGKYRKALKERPKEGMKLAMYGTCLVMPKLQVIARRVWGPRDVSDDSSAEAESKKR